MAAVDSLIRLITAQNADSLTLVSDQVPRLSRAGAAQPLSMPPVGAAMMEMFVGEVLTPAQIEEAQMQGALTAEYGEFVATVKRLAGGWSIAFKKRPARRGAAGPAAPTAAVVRAAAPVASVATPATGAPAPASVPAPVLAPIGSSAPSIVAAAHEAADESTLALLDRWLRRALDEHASDVIVSAHHGARLRVSGALVELPGAPLTDAQLMSLLAPALSDVHRAALAQHGSADLAFVWSDPQGSGERTRFRVNVFRQANGLAAAFRPVRRDPPTLADLHLPEALARLARFPNGLVLVTGPTGSGKSTTLVALVEQLNRETPRHIVTLEDPIEYEYRPQRALVHQRELGVHVDSFESGLRAALREAPDVILLGEMRDRATISAALTAAETGHLVLSSLHAGHAAMAVERIIDVFPEHQQRQVRSQLAASLRAVLTQHLLPATVPGTRRPAIELMISTSNTASLIRDGKTHQLASAIQTGRDDGMIPLDRSLADLVEARAVAYDTALALTQDAGLQLRELLTGGSGGRGRASR